MWFHEFIYDMRVMRCDMSLRDFCRRANLDPSNWSKVERGIANPPTDKDVLDKIAVELNLDQRLKSEMYSLALIGCIPPDLLPPENVLDKLPIFIRSMSGNRPNEKKLQKIIALLREETRSSY